MDVLLVCNLYMNFLLLRLTAKLTHERLTFGKTMLGAGLGSISSLVILLPHLPAAAAWAIKAVTAGVLCFAAFGWHGWRRLGWQMLCLTGMSCLMAGVLMGLSVSGLLRVYHANASWYPDIPLGVLVLFTILAYAVLTFIGRIRDRSPDTAYTVQIRYHSHIASLEGLADTGNTLTDFFTGKPVIICDKALLAPLLSDRMPPKPLRPLPCATVAGDGIVFCFSPDEVVIRSADRIRSVDVLIGMSGQVSGKAVFNPKLLRY